MDVRCENCSALYDFDEARVPPDGVAVKCGNCGHVFRAHRTTLATLAAEWTLRQGNGTTTRVADMAQLQRWIVERRVTRDDELSMGGQGWQRLGSMADLTPFFVAIGSSASPPGFPSTVTPTPNPSPTMTGAAADTGALAAARWEPHPQALPQFLTGGLQPGSAPAFGAGPESGSGLGSGSGSTAQVTAKYSTLDARQPSFSGDDDDLDLRPRRHRGPLIALAIILLVGVGLGATLILRPDIKESILGHKVSELAVQQVDAANLELRRDSYAAIERAAGMFAAVLTTEPRYAAAKAGLAQAELNRAEYLAEEISELEAKTAVAVAAPDADARPVPPEEIDKRKKEFQTRVDHAFAEAKGAIEIDPDGVAGLRAMADYYRIMKSPDSMKPLLDQARLAAPNDPLLAYVAGASVAGDTTLTERAIRYFDEALEAAPDLMRAHYRLARLFQSQANSPKALLHVETILKTVPDHERARVLLNELNPAPPPAPTSAAAVAAPTPPAVTTPVEPPKEKELTYQQLFAQADRLRSADKPKQALKLYERALEEQPNDPDAYTGLGWCYFDLEAYDSAVQNFKHALDLVPRFSDAHFGIAEAYRMKGNKSEAAKHYRAYLDILPEGDDAELAKRMLNELQQ